MKKCVSSEIASFHSILYHCFASFNQSLLYFFKLTDSRLILMLLNDSLNLIISRVHQSHLGCWVIGQKKLRGLDYVAMADMVIAMCVRKRQLNALFPFLVLFGAHILSVRIVKK